MCFFTLKSSVKKNKILLLETNQFQIIKKIKMKNLLLPLLILFSISFSIAQKKDTTIVIIENLGANINSEYDELNPIIAPDGKTLYYVRQNHPLNKIRDYKDVENQAIWFSTLGVDTIWQKAEFMKKPFNLVRYNGIISITPDGNTILIRGAYKDGVPKGNGYSFVVRKKKGWSKPNMLKIKKLKSMDAGINNSAFLSNDGQTLLLSITDETNGVNNDLFVSFMKEDKTWTKPKSLGPTVNTEEVNDASPFLASDGVTLYYGSNREGGKGGMDIYMTKRLDDTWEKWSEPVNMGDGINTSANEAYYSLDAEGKFAYMVTRKDSAMKSDIVKIELKKEFRPDPVVLVYGNVYNKKTLEPLEANLTYEVLSDSTQTGGQATTNPDDGAYKIIVKIDQLYGIIAKASGYMSASESVDTKGITEYTEIRRDLYLVPFEVGQTVRLQNIFFDHDKATLRPESFPELLRVVKFLNENAKITIEVSGHTDNVGSDEYNLKLSDDRAKSVKLYLESQGIATNRIQSKGYGETKHIAGNETEEDRQLNRRVEFTILTK
jgi:outer membrane protein OmpA-like peptidoglycan-associated protein